VQWKLYVPTEFNHVLKKLREIADQEGRSVSEIMRELAREYVQEKTHILTRFHKST